MENLKQAKLSIGNSGLNNNAKTHIVNALNYQMFNSELQQYILKYAEVGEKFPYQQMLEVLKAYTSDNNIFNRVHIQEELQKVDVEKFDKDFKEGKIKLLGCNFCNSFGAAYTFTTCDICEKNVCRQCKKNMYSDLGTMGVICNHCRDKS